MILRDTSLVIIHVTSCSSRSRGFNRWYFKKATLWMVRPVDVFWNRKSSYKVISPLMYIVFDNTNSLQRMISALNCWKILSIWITVPPTSKLTCQDHEKSSYSSVRAIFPASWHRPINFVIFSQILRRAAFLFSC